MLSKVFKIIRAFVLCICLIVMLLSVLFIYATKVEPYRLRIDTVNFQTVFSESLKVVQISDIQISESFTTDHLKKVVAETNEQDPDIVLFTGDLYEIYAEYHDDKALIDTLSAIEAPYGKFAVWGNRDYGGGAARQYETILKQSGFQLLQNEAVFIMLDNGEMLLLAGLDDALLGNPDITSIAEEFQGTEHMFSILMTHEPDTADLYSDIGFNLIVSGHSHGGQVNVPFLPKMTTSMAEKYVDGLYRLNEHTSLYVSSGIGTSRYPIRFGVVPEITAFSLEKEE